MVPLFHEKLLCQSVCYVLDRLKLLHVLVKLKSTVQDAAHYLRVPILHFFNVRHQPSPPNEAGQRPPCIYQCLFYYLLNFLLFMPLVRSLDPRYERFFNRLLE